MHRHELKFGGRFPQALAQRYAASISKARPGQSASKRVRGVQRNELLPFVPPEDWYETTGKAKGYRIVVQSPGKGFRHVLSPEDIRARLAQFPQHMLANLEVVQLSHMTRKKQSFPCYGMQWGTSLYLYPIEDNFIERYPCPPTPNQRNEARMYGGCWVQDMPCGWRLEWTEETIRDFYLNNILIHELGHLVDDRNTGYMDRERYAEWFALEYGYKRSHSQRAPRKVVRRHHKRGKLRSA